MHPAQLGHWHTAFSLTQDREDLRLSVSACLHSESPHPSCRENSTYADPYFRGGITHVERAGQVLIIDEYDADLMAIVPYDFLLHWLGKAKLDALGIRLDTPLRVKMSVIMDAFTGCMPPR